METTTTVKPEEKKDTPQAKENGYQPNTLTTRKVEELKQKIQKFIAVSNTTFLDATCSTKLEMRLDKIEKDVLLAVGKHFETTTHCPDAEINYFFFLLKGENYLVNAKSLLYKEKTTTITVYELIPEN